MNTKDTITWVVVLLTGFSFGFCIAYSLDRMADVRYTNLGDSLLIDTTTMEKLK